MNIARYAFHLQTATFDFDAGFALDTLQFTHETEGHPLTLFAQTALAKEPE